MNAPDKYALIRQLNAKGYIVKYNNGHYTVSIGMKLFADMSKEMHSRIIKAAQEYTRILNEL